MPEAVFSKPTLALAQNGPLEQEPEAEPEAEQEPTAAMAIDPATGQDKYHTDPVPEGKPLPVEPQDAVVGEATYSCTIFISCATILDNPDWLKPEKAELVPEDGVILAAQTVTFFEGGIGLQRVAAYLQAEFPAYGVQQHADLQLRLYRGDPQSV